LEAELHTYDQEIENLERARRELARIDTDKVLDKAREALARADEQAETIEQLRQHDQAADQAVLLAEAQAENARECQSALNFDPGSASNIDPGGGSSTESTGETRAS
jgi:hypothetical protein